MSAAAALGGVEFGLFTIALVVFSLPLHRHRAAGGHCLPVASDASATKTDTVNEAPVLPTQSAQPPMQEYPPTHYPA
ncbi:integral membrane protein [Phlyctema vagabunda]|uniref:Integral membrane protein n=1 Tax=Phlyctema vagabunda TaxID=108571 RepID=A0ABR4PF65_9HELO